jgi:hypothetical protein
MICHPCLDDQKPTGEPSGGFVAKYLDMLSRRCAGCGGKAFDGEAARLWKGS